MIKLKLYGMVLAFTIPLMGCSDRMYLPEAHTYSNNIQTELANANICTQTVPTTCSKFVDFTSFGVKFSKLEYGSVNLNVLGVNSTVLANAIIANCKKTKLSLRSTVPVTLNLYNVTALTSDSKPILAAVCD